MRRLIFLALAGLSLSFCSVYAYPDVPIQIDGTSEATFQESHNKLMQSLTLEQQNQLKLAEIIIRATATPKETLASGHRTIVPLTSIRSELNGLTFRQILALARSKKADVSLGVVVKPSN